jgi:hypothetical protein
MAPDIMRNVYGRKTSRSDNHAVRIDARGPSTNYHDHRRNDYNAARVDARRSLTIYLPQCRNGINPKILVLTYVVGIRRTRLGIRTARINDERACETAHRHTRSGEQRNSLQSNEPSRRTHQSWRTTTEEANPSGQSQSSEQMIAGGPAPRIHVRDRVAACEIDIQRFDQEIHTGSAFFPTEPMRFDVTKDDDGDYEEDGSEWCRQSPRRDRMNGGTYGEGENKNRAPGRGEGNVGARNYGESDWRRRPQTRTRDQYDRDDGASIVVSSTGSGGSRSLDARKKGRDVVLARLEFQGADRETRRMELELAELDAYAGLARRSRNSSQASSLHWGTIRCAWCSTNTSPTLSRQRQNPWSSTCRGNRDR